MDEINALSWEPFIQQFGNVVEHGRIVAGAIWGLRPFADTKALHEAVCEFMDSLPPNGKESILRCYPDPAGRLAQANQLSSESAQEQSSAGLLNLSQEESNLIADMNTRYKEKFNFPFVICARENKKVVIIAELKSRIHNSKDAELEKGINEVKKIAWYRIVDATAMESKSAISKM
ncbi:2-oxo-4-hydroxy-4-carboxy-5-ureidoimidazoline decarboxylase-like [Asterias rubens]|uniref:2-oxo-4-hydroxy-4-carboxy-5-ureidoimidazoline decarboxylase-like n=1 Tax=Asterias rubens TaxID=7604 RepID=UPI00145595D4|nr:2-oxo-4-hydroxy-4-carboxy-5-ureidoimidazoline decarboxylase-like [Asterias rubens]